MNIMDYIKLHQNEDFKKFPFTEVDNLIFSCIPYIDYTGIVPAFRHNKITLNEAVSKLNKNPHSYHGLFIGNTYKMLNLMKDTKRYGNTLLFNYMKVVNNEIQFGAITMLLNDKSTYIAYAGTDTSIIGWEEDFKMAYLYPGVSQKYASIYLNKALGLFPKNVRVGGHSKGGNLAICAAMNAKNYYKRKIIAIYNNDGPGFLKQQLLDRNYRKIQNKIKMFVPEQSIIGMILYHSHDYEVVKAKGFSILQHDAFNWKCNNKEFIKSKLNKRSKTLEHKLTEKLENMPKEDKLKLVNDLFKIFYSNNIKDTKDISITNIFKIIKSFKKLDKETQRLLIEFLLIIFVK